MPAGDTFAKILKMLNTQVPDTQKNSLTDFLIELGIFGKNALEKVIPGVIFTLPKQKMALFLNRLFACDGSIVINKDNTVRLSYASSSYVMAEQVKHLLLRFGIIAKLREKKIKYRDQIRTAFEVEVFGASEILLFAKEIGIFGQHE